MSLERASNLAYLSLLVRTMKVMYSTPVVVHHDEQEM
jgi:hypothetical protein